MSFSYVKLELRFLHLLEIVRGWLVVRSQYSLAGTFHRRRSPLLKTGFFRHVRELKIQRKNLGSALHSVRRLLLPDAEAK
jgi:hypothetical protein